MQSLGAASALDSKTSALAYLAQALQIQRSIGDRAGEAVGNGVVEILAAAKNVLAADANQRQRAAPR